MKSLRISQRGATPTSILFTMLLIGFGVTLGINMIPAYMDNNTVATILKNVKENLDSKDSSTISFEEVRSEISRNFQVNMVSSEIEQYLLISREQDGLEISVNYEVRKNLMANVDVVMRFDNMVKIGQ